jgi:hypothetical protein
MPRDTYERNYRHLCNALEGESVDWNMHVKSIGMLLTAPAFGLTVAACGSGAAQPTKQATVALSTPSTTATPSSTLSTASLPQDPCQWLLESDAQQLLGVAINTKMDGQANCSYSPGTLEATASPAPGAADGASLDILDSTSFASGQTSLQADGVTYSIVFVPSANVIPGSSTNDATFFAIGSGSSAHPAWTYLYVQIGGNVSFRVGLLAPSLSAPELEAKDQTAALDVLRNLKLH